MTQAAILTRPDWNSAVRFPAGSRLQVQVLLRKEIRDALAHVSRNAALWLESIDGSAMRVEHLSDRAFRLCCDTTAGAAEFDATHVQDQFHRLVGHVEVPGGQRRFVLEGVHIQLGGPCDSYIAVQKGGASQQIARLRYAVDGGTVDVSVYNTVLAERLPASVRALLPNPIDMVRVTLVSEGGVEQRAAHHSHG